MRKALAISLTLFVIGAACLSQSSRAQMSLTGVGSVGAAAAYVGPGDIVSFDVWVGTRCYSASYVGNVARIKSPSDALTTTITCATGGVLGSTGTALATTCAVSCTIDVLYDQSGALRCTTACNLAEPTEAARPALVLNAVGTKNCALFTRASSQQLSGASASSTFASPIAQPFSYSAVAKQVTNVGGNQAIVSAGSTLAGFGSSADTAIGYAGIIGSASATADALHALQFVVNGASSTINVDGGSSTVNMGAGTVTAGDSPALGNDPFANFLNGYVCEAGLKSAAFSGGNMTALSSNQHSYWGF